MREISEESIENAKFLLHQLPRDFDLGGFEVAVEIVSDFIEKYQLKIDKLTKEKYEQQLRYGADKTRLQRQIDKHNSWVIQRFDKIERWAVKDSDMVILPPPESVKEYVEKLEGALSKFKSE